MRALLVCFAMVIAPAVAAAQPSNTPVNTPVNAPVNTPTESGTYKSPSTALALSLGGTVGSFALIAIGGSSEDLGGLASAGSLGLWLAPSFGHWYVGKGWTPGLKWRLAGAGAATLGIMWVALDCIGSSCEDDMHPGVMLAIGGGVAVVGGMVHDIATAPSAAREHNARLDAGRVQNVTVRPSFGSGRAGLAISGRF
ncbi:MAG TPA: hypothetical protein VM261_05335 [Kofleriaceae bacterium]|nr:hypothetical protein [Kofleriaceae bacterium]